MTPTSTVTPDRDEVVKRLPELRKIAEAATPGPWKHWHNFAGPRVVYNEVQATRLPAVVKWAGFDDSERSAKKHVANALHIATFDPPTVLSLIDRIASDGERIARLWNALCDAVRMAGTIAEEWDKAPDGMRAGKLLIALSGRLSGYRKDIDTIHDALAALTDSPKGGTT